MSVIAEGRLQFSFPEGWKTSKFDQWSFYRNQFIKLGNAEVNCSSCESVLECASCGAKRLAGTKGVDILAIEVDAACWLIEIKDYRLTRIANLEFLADVVALKARDTLAALAAAKWNANDAEEKTLAGQVLACPKIRIVLHLEQPAPRSSVQLVKTRKVNLLQRLKQLVKAIDPHPKIVDRNHAGTVPWTVTEVGSE